MKYLFAITLLFLVQFSFGQDKETTNPMDINTYFANSNNAQMPTIMPLNRNIEGDYYLYDKWDNYARIYTNGKSLKLNSFNYNLHRDLVETKIAADSVFSFKSSAIDSIVVNNRILKQVHTQDGEGSNFAEILYEGNGYIFFKKFVTKLNKAEVNPITGNFDFPDKIEKESKYYLITPKGQTENFDLKRRDLTKVLNVDRTELRNFAKEQDLSWREENDVIKIIKHFTNK